MPEPTTTRSIWERMEHEEPKAYFAFSCYRNLGRERSLRTAHELYRGIVPGERKSKGIPPYFAKWSSEYAWIERARSYDAHLLDLVREAEEAAMAGRAGVWAARFDAQREREWQMAEDLLEKADEMLTFPLAKTETVIEEKGGKRITKITVHPADWRLGDVATIIKTASHLGRLAVGDDDKAGMDKKEKKQVMMIGNTRIEF